MFIASVISIVITILVFLLILSVLVLIHEAGHYFVAKKFGIKVEEFGFGFPLTPALFSIKRGETVYSFYPVLIGGFVKLYGEDEAGGGKITAKHKESKEDLHRAFFSRPIWQRASVVVAGVLMNVLLAAVIYYIFLGMSNFKTALPVLGNETPKFIFVNQTVVPKGIAIGQVSKNSPAEKAGIKAPSVLLSIGGKKVESNDGLVALINANKGKEISIEWWDVTLEKKFSARVTPRVSPPANEGALGIAFDFNKYTIAFLTYETPTQKMLSGVSHSYNVVIWNMNGLKSLLDQAIKEENIQPISKNVSGPIGIGSVVGEIIGIKDVKDRMLQLLNLAGLLSISLAVFNVLPIPGLDGGRLFFIILEAIFRRKISPKVEGYIHAVGMVFLLALIILVTIKDVMQIFIK